MTSTTAQQHEILLDSLYAAWRAKDVDGILACLTDDCVYEDLAMRVVNRGHEAVAQFVYEVYETMPDFHVEHNLRFATETHGCGQWVISATWRGPFEGVDRTGTRISFTGLALYQFRDGKICLNLDCWDPTVLYEQFGVLPAALQMLAMP